MKTLAQLEGELRQAMHKSENAQSQSEMRYEFFGGFPGSSAQQGKKPAADPPVLSSLERVIETLATTQVQNTPMFSEF